jgi:hypothetical protein
MNKDIEAMLTACEGRYPTRAEQATLRGWAGRFEVRLAAIEEIRECEDKIVTQTVDEVLRNYPDFERRFKGGRQTCLRDETLVLRFCAQALLREDMHYLEAGLLVWLATILRGVGFTPQFVAYTYSTLIQAADRELSPGVAELLRPYLQRCVAVLGGDTTAKETS